MREIKFRAWLKNEKKMIDVKAIDWDENGNVFSVNYPEGKSYSGYDKDEIELLQYTGLKDKNGVEIYEGNIIQFQPEPEESPYHNKYVVDFFQEDCSFTLFEKGKAKLGLFEYERNEIIVIGNIYENPELLEK